MKGPLPGLATCGLVLGLAVSSVPFTLQGASKKEAPFLSLGSDGKLAYNADAHGNRVPDFSHCGYAGGDEPIPLALPRVIVAAESGDSTARIQTAIDYVSQLPLETNGLRGAVLLLKGRHELLGGLHIEASGVVLRGQGMGAEGTVLVAAGLDRRTLIRIIGKKERTSRSSAALQIADNYVPVGAMSFHLKAANALTVGQTINIIRPSTKAWIERLNMTEFGGGIGDWRLVWKPGSRDLVWDRRVTAVDGDLISVDAPITTALEKEFGTANVEPYQWPGRIRNVGVANLRCESTFDASNPKDENHSWCAITMENAQDAWVRQVTALHFAGSMVALYESCKQVTVEDCLSLAPVSEEGGYRRHSFFSMGQQTLFLHCQAEHGRHDFTVGDCAAGPNAFVQCGSKFPLRDSGPIESWASGVLYDGVTIDGNGLCLCNRGANPEGAGWAAANSVLWQCSASSIVCENPPTAQNWAFGCWGEFAGNGNWQHSNESVKPESLYQAQLAERLGAKAAERLQLMHRSTEERSNPAIEEAAQLIAASRQPAPQLTDYIASAHVRDPIPDEAMDAKLLEDLVPNVSLKTEKTKPKTIGKLVITNGWLAWNGELLIGARTNVAWWRGTIRPGEAAEFEPGVTRFVTGRIGPGFTDDLGELADTLKSNGIAALDHNYGLWYERRRDDHERVRRADGDVWPPFYEMPFARTGQGTAWDGLSLYDLTKYNPWYWRRLKQFAELGAEQGLVLFHQNYFQHNILEAGAHWADFPWRPANNINNTGFPEPPPYAGDKRIFMAAQFYDTNNPVRRPLHRAYIRQCLDNFVDDANVIQFTSAEFTGPLEFMQFWLDTIEEWSKETGRKPLVALSCTKDVQDAILSDPRRAAVVSLVDFRYWWRTAKGTFAPKGGQNLAPRQFERQWKGGKPSDLSLAQMAAEYRRRAPGKGLICDFAQGSWAFLCAGGSMPNLPKSTDPRLRSAIIHMQPWSEGCAENRWVLREVGKQYLVCCAPGAPAELDLTRDNQEFVVRDIDPHTGVVSSSAEPSHGKGIVSLPAKVSGLALYWLTATQSD